VPKVVVDGARNSPNVVRVAQEWSRRDACSSVTRTVPRQAYDFWMGRLAALLAAGGARGAAPRLIPDHTVHRCCPPAGAALAPPAPAQPRRC
jgi:hypothetical protein